MTFAQQARKARDCAQRAAQVMRDRVAERLELAVRLLELPRPAAHALFHLAVQARVLEPDGREIGELDQGTLVALREAARPALPHLERAYAPAGRGRERHI